MRTVYPNLFLTLYTTYWVCVCVIKKHGFVLKQKHFSRRDRVLAKRKPTTFDDHLPPTGVTRCRNPEPFWFSVVNGPAKQPRTGVVMIEFLGNDGVISGFSAVGVAPFPRVKPRVRTREYANLYQNRIISINSGFIVLCKPRWRTLYNICRYKWPFGPIKLDCCLEFFFLEGF